MMNTSDIEIRQAVDSDWAQIWPVVHSVFLRGDTFPHAPDTSESAAFEYWMRQPVATLVAVSQDQIVGSCYIRPNQPDAGNHVCNAGFMVAETYRRRGIGRALCRQAMIHAKESGFRAMQFNLVVASNHASIQLWQQMGFATIGTLPGAFRHPLLGYVDAHILYRVL